MDMAGYQAMSGDLVSRPTFTVLSREVSRRAKDLGNHRRAFEHGLVENVLLIHEHEIKLLVLVNVRVQHDQHRCAGYWLGR